MSAFDSLSFDRLRPLAESAIWNVSLHVPLGTWNLEIKGGTAKHSHTNTAKRKLDRLMAKTEFSARNV